LKSTGQNYGFFGIGKFFSDAINKIPGIQDLEHYLDNRVDKPKPHSKGKVTINVGFHK